LKGNLFRDFRRFSRSRDGIYRFPAFSGASRRRFATLLSAKERCFDCRSPRHGFHPK